MRHCRTDKGTLEWFKDAAHLPPDWDDSLPTDHYLGTLSLQAHEAAHLPDITTIYACTREGGKIWAQAAFQVLALQSGHLNPTTLKPWQRRLWGMFTKIAHPKLLVAGHLFRHDIKSFHWVPKVSAFDAFQWYRLAIEKAVSIYHTQAVLVKEPGEELVPYFQHYAPEYMLLRNDSSMQMNLPETWQNLNDYEKSLKHKYAQRLRKVRQSWQELTTREWTEQEVNDQAENIYRLYLQVTHNQPVRLGLLSKNFIPALKQFYGDRLKVWGIYEGDTLIAFASAWVQEESFDMFYIGFDYECNARLNLYFNILFFSIEQAILLGKKELILGRTALEAKARVGCKPHYLHTFLYIRNSLLRKIIGGLQQKVSEGEGEWENRHPFKPGKNE